MTQYTDDHWTDVIRPAQFEPNASMTQVGGGHYCSMTIQPVDFIYSNNIQYLEGNVIKYVCRHRDKNGKQDLEKAIHYLQLLIEREYESE